MLSKIETRAWVILSILVLFVGTFVGVRTTQQVEKTVRATNIIIQCTTPKTPCFILAEKNRITNQDFQKKTIMETTLCLGIASRAAGDDDTLLEQKFDECVASRVPAPPPVPQPLTPLPSSKGDDQ